ncbi:MAG: alpha/beta fold hydrolase [Acidobacteriota bacterium]
MRLSSKLLSIPAFVFLSLLPTSQAATDDSFVVNGVRIHYMVEGKGQPVVLIHGLNSSAAHNWQLPGIISLLSKDYQVIAVDMPGHGKSDKPLAEEAYGAQMVEYVIRLLDHLKIKKAHIIGYSMGGMIAVKLMVKYPERALSGLVCGMGWLREGSAMQKVLERIPAGRRSQTPAVCARSLGKLAVSEEEIKSIRVPVEVLVGDRDPVRRLFVAPLAEVRRDWKVVEIRDAGHLSCVVRQQFKDEIKNWLDKNSGRN